MASPDAVTISAQSGAHDPLAEARSKLFPPLRNRALAEAADALAEKQVEIAEALLATYLEKKPRDADALNLMAEVARRARRFTDAEQLLAQCVDQSPDSIGFRYNYAVVLRQVHKYELALAHIDTLLEKDAKNVLFRDQKATILTRMGRHAEALQYRRALCEEFPLSTNAWLQLGHALRDEGFHDECLAAFHKALQLDPSFTAAYASLAGLKVYRFTETEIREMERQLIASNLSSDARADLHHAAGKGYGDRKLYAKSFEHYAKANALRRINVNFSKDTVAAHRQGCERVFTEAFFRQRTGWGDPSRCPIFIVGLPRSGSTLIEQILSSHSAIEGLGELPDLDSALVQPILAFADEVQLQDVYNGSAVDKSGLLLAYLELFDRLGADTFRAIGEHYLQITLTRRTTGRPFFTDKALRNFLYVGLMQIILPNAKIIDARRHPLDCGWSCFKSQFLGNHFSLRLSDIGYDYVNYVRLMAHFDRVLPGKIHRVIHEELVADPERELRRLFAYLDLPFEEKCLRFYENKRPVFTQSSEQVRKPLSTAGMGQWVPYEPWLGPLKAALGPVLESYPRVPESIAS